MLGLLLTAPGARGTETPASAGKYLVHAAGCVTCHTEDREGAQAFAGGRAMATSFGTFYTPNITPDPETGIGGWTVEDMRDALRTGWGPGDKRYYPAFPYTSYTGMSDEDADAIATYLLGLAPVRRENKPHQLRWYASSRLAMAGWNSLHFKPRRFQPEPARDATWNRGAYLVRHLGHCGECHSPRTPTGGVRTDLELSGNSDGPDDESVPNITPHPDDGIGDWSLDDITLFLATGMLPDGDFTGSSMSPVIDDNTSRLTDADRTAIATYLMALPPVAGKPHDHAAHDHGDSHGG
jgi:mono/diheme cytochrome c family protein